MRAHDASTVTEEGERESEGQSGESEWMRETDLLGCRDTLVEVLADLARYPRDQP